MSGNLYNQLHCHLCGKVYDKNKINTFCNIDNQPLIASFNLDQNWKKEDLIGNSKDMWRYSKLLPIDDKKNQISLGEGYTPIIELNSLSKKFSQNSLLLKEEAGNPTGSFKARGISMAVSKAKELGIQSMCIPTAGNAGSALSAYCAKAGIEAHVYMPEETPQVFQLDCEIMGAKVSKVKGDISDAATLMRSENNGSWFDMTTLKEPFRLEGKKTIGYEIAEQLDWQLPDVIIYPTGGGTGLIGIWKAFQELVSLGWIENLPTRMVAVQTVGCDPIVKAFSCGSNHAFKYANPKLTIANGLRVPQPFGDRMILKAIYQSSGNAISVTENEIIIGMKEFAKTEGVFLSPEGAAVWAAYKMLRSSRWINDRDNVVLLNTGSPYKYIENLF
jgi:threonine synthase